MTRDDIISMLTTQLGNRTDLQSDGTIKTYLQFAQETVLEIDPFTPWFLEKTNNTLVSVIGNESITLPTDFRKEVEGKALEIYTSGATEPWVPLHKDDYDWIVANYPGSGTPKAYALGTTELKLRAVPDAVYTFRLMYIAKGANLNTTATSVWTENGASWLMAVAGSLLAGRVLRDTQLRAQFDSDATFARTQLIAAHEARGHTNRFYQMGDD